ncbi:MAG TPA: alcohol dehydrogenase catalytic domain-containing protein [Candidatus Dietzia intestinigallinarum]|nr:alcohol dehydrogenase catalytic domain-containing protein [Candidatus Dietzia intestinigallinarum]
MVSGVICRDGEVSLVDDLEVRAPGPHEVSVQVVASGLCASDLLPMEAPDPAPMALGHEASGVVTRVGELVRHVSVGDNVAVTCQRPCMNCKECSSNLYSACATTMYDPEPLFRWRGEPVRSLARVSSLASQITVDGFQVHPVVGLQPHAAALIGCAVSTGYGSVKNIGQVTTSDAVVVVGVGGIGVNSLQTARLLGARRVIAVDTNPDKEKVSETFGADQFVLADATWTADEFARGLGDVIGDTVDVVIECTGQPAVVAGSVELLGTGGRLALVGISPRNPSIQMQVPAMMSKHLSVRSGYNGACDPFVDFPAIVRFAEQGRFDLAGQVSHVFALTEIDDALDALRSGRVLRAVIDMPGASAWD